MTTIDTAAITVVLPEAFDERWSRLPGIQIDGRRINIDPAEYFFRFESSTWLVADWELVKSQLLNVEETTESAVEQLALEFIKTHAKSTSDASTVLATAYEVYTYLFRDEHLVGLGLPQFTADHLRMLREAATLMALNKVELDGHISNVGPCWFFPAATSVVFDLDDKTGAMLDEVYHGGWFNEHRRIEAIKAHAALGGRLVHGCQSVPDQSGGVVAPYGASMTAFRDDLAAFKSGWIEQVYAHRVAPPRSSTALAPGRADTSRPPRTPPTPWSPHVTANPSTELFDNLLTLASRTTAVREEVRVWSMSGVERLTFPDGATAIFKYAKRPFDSEDQALRLAHTFGVPVPVVHASAVLDGWLGMLLEDLGAPIRKADDLDGAAAAVVLHGTRTAAALPVLDQERLRTLPSRALEHLGQLRKADRWQDADDVEDALDRIAQAAEARSAGATVAPFGWVHSEFHPTSLHVGRHGWRLLDFARAFTGPGLLDLASWHGTLDTPDPVRLRVFLDTYVTEGGTPDALAERGGLPAEKWALGWHRMWAVEWFMEQSIRWINDPATDPAYIRAVRRHLTDVLHLLEV